MKSIFLCVCLALISWVSANPSISQDKPAFQSTTIHNLHAGLAVDGKTEQHYSLGSCSSTNNQVKPWWYVDLEHSYTVWSVTIYNRQAAGQYLKNFEVLIRNRSTKKYTQCARHSGASRSREIIVLKCYGKNVDRVMIRSHARTHLFLCEVKIFGQRTKGYDSYEVAHDMETRQSSNYGNYFAGLALDGNPSSNFGHRTCTHTRADNNPWWMVRLDGNYHLDRVVIYNRNAAGSRLGNFVVEYTTDRDAKWKECARVRRNGKNREIFVLHCRGKAVGSYVRIRLSKRTFLTLCEVRVYGY